MLTNLLASISQSQLEKVVQPVIDVCNVLVPIALAVVGALGALWCILLGVKYAKTDDPQEHEKAKKGLKNAIIGFVLIWNIFPVQILLEMSDSITSLIIDVIILTDRDRNNRFFDLLPVEGSNASDLLWQVS